MHITTKVKTHTQYCFRFMANMEAKTRSSEIKQIFSLFAVVSLCLHSFVAIYTSVEPQDKHDMISIKDSVCEDESLECGWYHRVSNRFIYFIINAIRLLPDLPGWNCYIGTVHLLIIILTIRIALEKSNDKNELVFCFCAAIILCVVSELRHIWYNDLISFVTCALIYCLILVAYDLNKEDATKTSKKKTFRNIAHTKGY